MIVHFIANFPYKLHDLEVKADFRNLLMSKKIDEYDNEKFENTDKNKERRTIMTISGNSAISECILNEK